jgi:hypothetical protein
VAVDDAHEPVTVTDTPTAPPAEPEPSSNGAEGVRDPEALARSKEAAGYRVRLREAEAHVVERDAAIGALRSEVDRLHTLEAERVAATSMASPGDLWLVTNLAELRDSDGRLDATKVGETVKSVLAERPTWKRTMGGFDGGARQPVAPERRPGLSHLLKPEASR